MNAVWLSSTVKIEFLPDIVSAFHVFRSQEEDSVALNECLQLIFHQACRHHLVLLYPREILVLDLDINQTVGIIPMERTGSPFVQVLAVFVESNY